MEYSMSGRALEVLENIDGVSADYCFSYIEDNMIVQRRGYSPYMVGKIIEYLLDKKTK